jgi:hypothetical protein
MLYKNSGRAKGTLRFFREKLQRRNVTQDIKHYEECEQLFISVGKSYTLAALLHFFGMSEVDDSPQKNVPPHDADYQQYFDTVLDKFVNEYLLSKPHSQPNQTLDEQPDQIKEYSLCLLRLFFILKSLKDAVKLGDGDRLATIRKVLLKHFKSHSGHNTYAIEMLISILQDKVFLTKRQAHQTRWASLVNSRGGSGNNIEIDLMQENLNRELKKGISGMGANKTPKAIERFSKAAWGEAEIITNFDVAMKIKKPASSHKHKSSEKDENIILADLLQLKPFESIDGRFHEGFPSASSNTLAALNEKAFHDWLKKHKKNLIKHGPIEMDDDDSDDDQ